MEFEELDIENILPKSAAHFLLKILEFLKYKLQIEYEKNVISYDKLENLLINDVNNYLADYI